MALFVVLGLMTVVALALLVTPLMRRQTAAAPRAAYDMEIYRDQLGELERDVARGVIGAAEQATARTEIERRMLAAAPANAAGPAAPAESHGLIAAFAIMVLLPFVAGGLYLGLGSPGLEDRPFVERPPQAATPPPQTAAGGEMDIEGMVASLAERLTAEPNDLDGWLMLGRSYGVLGRYDQAVTALEHAERLSGEDPDVTAMLAEHRVFAAEGLVSPAAVADFEAALAKDPGQSAARFYLAMAQAQAGRYQAALDAWIVLAGESPADAPWMEALRAQIVEVSATLGVAPPGDLGGIAAAAAPPGPSAEDVAAAASMSEGEQTEMIRSMVERLAARLEDEPDDLEGWQRLGRSYGVLGEDAKARAAYARAAALVPDDPARLSEYAEAITQTVPEGAPLPAEAVAVFRRLAAVDADSPVALWHLGLAAAKGGKPAEARAFWNRLITVLPAGSSDQAAVQRAIDSL